MTIQEIIEKIRAEKIIRLIISILEDKHPNTFWRSNEMESGVYTEELVSFLSDLEKECEEKPTTAEGLEEEYKDYVESDPVYGKLVNRNAGLSIARHFYELGRQEKPTTAEGLEEEIERYLSTEWELDEDLNKDEPIYIYDCTWEDLKIFARHFAQWGAEHAREQMMKEAVEGRVVDAGIFATYNTPVEYTHSGDKVKLIIVKED